MPENTTELSAIAIISIFFLKEFFAYLRTKKNGNGHSVNYEKELALINQKLDNHILHICDDIKEIKDDIKKITEAIWWKQIKK